MKLIIFLLFVFLQNNLKSQVLIKYDSIPEINDFSNFQNNKNFKKIKILLFDSLPTQNSLIILDGKIYNPNFIDLDYVPNKKPKLVSKIIDTNSKSGINYIYIYKTK